LYRVIAEAHHSKCTGFQVIFNHIGRTPPTILKKVLASPSWTHCPG